MNTVSTLRAVWVGIAVFAASAQAAEPAPAVALLSDNSFAAWEHVLADASVAKEQVWSFRDGTLVCTGKPIGVLYTAKDYTNFKLQVEYRWAPGQTPGNSGVMTRMTPGTGALPLTCEVQLQHGNAGDVVGLQGFAIADPQQPRWFEKMTTIVGKVTGVKRAVGAENAPGEWNRLEVEVVGGRYTVRMNGKLVNEVTGVSVKPGRIGLQSEGGEIHFRKLVVQPLPEA